MDHHQDLGKLRHKKLCFTGAVLEDMFIVFLFVWMWKFGQCQNNQDMFRHDAQPNQSLVVKQIQSLEKYLI